MTPERRKPMARPNFSMGSSASVWDYRSYRGRRDARQTRNAEVAVPSGAARGVTPYAEADRRPQGAIIPSRGTRKPHDMGSELPKTLHRTPVWAVSDRAGVLWTETAQQSSQVNGNPPLTLPPWASKACARFSLSDELPASAECDLMVTR